MTARRPMSPNPGKSPIVQRGEAKAAVLKRLDAEVERAALRQGLTPLREVTAHPAVKQFFTDSEWRVIVGYSRDMTAPEVATELILSLHTIKTHATVIRRALGVHTAQGIVAECFRRGWLK